MIAPPRIPADGDEAIAQIHKEITKHDAKRPQLHENP
jgi:hypothetical protein